MASKGGGNRYRGKNIGILKKGGELEKGVNGF